jgi:hypothetical protein
MKNDQFEAMMAFGQDNADAMAKSGAAAFKGAEEMAKAAQLSASRAMERADGAVKALMACKTPTDLADLQGRLVRESIEVAIAESRTYTELTTAWLTEAMGPWTSRFTAFQSVFTPTV